MPYVVSIVVNAFLATALAAVARAYGLRDLSWIDASNMSQRVVAQKFVKSMTGRVSNRKFVNAVMPFIA